MDRLVSKNKYTGRLPKRAEHIKKAFRRRRRQCVDRYVNNQYEKRNVTLKNRKLSTFWNVIKRRRVKSPLCATEFGEIYGNVMQVLPECTVKQNHDKHMVEQYYNDYCYLTSTHAVDQDQVDMLISNLHEEKSPGLDGITAEQIHGKSSLLCSLLASLYTVTLSRAYLHTLLNPGLIVPVLKKPTLKPTRPYLQ